MGCGIDQPFRRVWVRFAVNGGGRVEWSLDRRFNDPMPHAYQLQGAPSSNPDETDWVDVGLPAANTFFAVDDAKRVCGKTLEWHYRVVLTTPAGTYASPVSNALSGLGFRDWRIAEDLKRREKLRHELFTSVEGYLLKRKRFGTPCPVCIEPMTGDTTDADCPTCYGTRVLGGYYAAVPDYFVEKGLEAADEEVDNAQAEGTVKKSAVWSRVLGDPLVNSYDVFAEKQSGRRYYVRPVKEAAVHRGYPVVQEVQLRLAPFSDVIYEVSLDEGS